jgi:hypothetical protein
MTATVQVSDPLKTQTFCEPVWIQVDATAMEFRTNLPNGQHSRSHYGTLHQKLRQRPELAKGKEIEGSHVCENP